MEFFIIGPGFCRGRAELDRGFRPGPPGPGARPTCSFCARISGSPVRQTLSPVLR